MKTVFKRGLGVLLAMLMVIAILPSITINAKAASGVDDFVTRCYQVAFQRTPDQGGFDFWKAKITDGKLVGSTVVYEFIFSEEYEGQNRTDKEYVNDLYTMFMGRAADQQGYDYWCGQIDAGMSRKDVFAGFANSKEFYELCYNYGITSGFFTNDYEVGQVNNVNLFVERLYKTCLGRLGDQGGQKYWVEGMLKGELTGIGCAANYIKSQEYEALGLTDEQYVENLYIGFMGRTYDEGGKANWLGHLTNKTKTRDQVFEGFANSPEFQGICAGYGIECGSYTATDIAKKRAKVQYERNCSDGEIDYYTTYEYDSNGNIIVENRYFYGNDSVTWQDFYEYDSNNNMISHTSYEWGEFEDYITFEYDSNGKLLYKNYYDEDGERYICVEYIYDSKGNNVQENTINEDGSIRNYTTNIFNDQGLMIESDFHFENGYIWFERFFEYDSAGTLRKRIVYTDGYLSDVDEYDADGFRISYTYYYKNGGIEPKRYTYEYEFY